MLTWNWLNIWTERLDLEQDTTCFALTSNSTVPFRAIFYLHKNNEYKENSAHISSTRVNGIEKLRLQTCKCLSFCFRNCLIILCRRIYSASSHLETSLLLRQRRLSRFSKLKINRRINKREKLISPELLTTLNQAVKRKKKAKRK